MIKNNTPPGWLEEATKDPSFVTLVGPKGRAVKLYCPFIVVCICPVSSFKKLQAVIVTEVCTTTDRRLVYIIAGQAYYQQNFRILIEQ